MIDWLNRTEMLIGKDNINKLKNSTIAVFGIGGVGSYVIESLARCGVGNLVLIDNDIVDITNINRQLIADTTVIGKNKVDVAKERLLKINPEINVITHKLFFSENSSKDLISNSYNYIVDCIDSVSSKLYLIETAINNNINIISCMGTGNKLSPCQFEVSDIYKTSVCPLAKVIRKELSKKGIKKLKVVYSKETPIKTNSKYPASISFVPATAGLILASEVVNDLMK